jgi:hypothetical protein
MAEIRRRLIWDTMPVFFWVCENLRYAADIVHQGPVSKRQSQR